VNRLWDFYRPPEIDCSSSLGFRLQLQSCWRFDVVSGRNEIHQLPTLQHGVANMNSRISRDSVLIIDDDPYLRELIDMIGHSCSVPVLQAADCHSGLKVLESDGRRIKLILLDYFMPGMQPVQCADEIITRAGPKIPVVLITAAVDPSARAAELKIKRWISKPFETSTMSHLLSEKPSYRAARR
jgi:CheY-like chemotaxis protein